MSIEELGRRAVTCKHWRWMPGMLMRAGTSSLRIQSAGDERADLSGIPDLSDPATLGCLLHLVQAAWTAARISLCYSAYTPNQERAWAVPITYLNEHVGSGDGYTHVPSFYGRTHGEALVAALEAAP